MDTVKNKIEASEIIINSLFDNVLNSPKFSWKRFWATLAENDPFNPIGKYGYKGINYLILQFYSIVKGCHFYATFNQIKDANGLVNKDAKGLPIVKYTIYYKHNSTKKTISEKDYKKLSDLEKKEYTSKSILTYSTVFSLVDTNIDWSKYSKDKEQLPYNNTPIELGEKIVTEYAKVVKIVYGGNQPCYIPCEDVINLPFLNQFETSNAFYSVAFHEIAHSTGSMSRLKRKFSGLFGSEQYSKEELIAEITSTLICTKIGVMNDTLLDNSCAYLKSWVGKFNDQRNELFNALVEATKAKKYISDVVKIQL
jgi:antirestriction protein ArdC